MFERIFAGVMLLAMLPFFAAIALAIRALSGRSPFVTHLRVGWKGQPLRVIKFRTMWPRTTPLRCERGFIRDTVTNGPVVAKPQSDPRVTSRFAAWCRTTSVDELPQLWHVATGEMALVGPRPLVQSEIEEHYGSAAGELLSVRPGITGLWQVMGRNRLTYPQRKRLDLFFVRRYSLRLYLLILCRTIPNVLARSGAW